MRVGFFLLNILLAVLWSFMWGQVNLYALLCGFVLGYLLLGMVGRLLPHKDESYGRKVFSVISFGGYFLKILIVANLQVAREVCTPGFQMTPAIIRYDVSDLTGFQITSLANAITLTPGTLSVDVTDDENTLYVHCMYAKDRDEAVRGLDELRDRLMAEVFG